LSSFLYSNRVSTWPVTSTWAASTEGAASDSTSAAVKRTAVFFMVIPLGVCDDAATHASWNWDEGCDGCCIDCPVSEGPTKPGVAMFPRRLLGLFRAASSAASSNCPLRPARVWGAFFTSFRHRGPGLGLEPGKLVTPTSAVRP